LRHVEREEVMRGLAEECVRIGEFASARAVYETLGDKQMLAFLSENFAA
jgi:hypothetical protein